MKLDCERLQHGIESAKQCLISKQQKIFLNGKNYLTWPLFFRESSTPNSDVDVCTSGLGVIALTKFDINSSNTLKRMVANSVNTLISIRNEDGSWPSKISLVSRDEFSMEGVISDTYYALSALLSVGFLTENPIIDEFKNLKLDISFDTLDKRIKFINDSVEWLLKNRVDHDQGWQYTGISYLENNRDKATLPAYTTPTANAVIILAQIVNKIKATRPSHAMIGKINSAIDNSIGWFCDIQAKDKKNCGFGIKRGERSRVGNTARVIIALCSTYSESNQKAIRVLQKAVNWLIRNYKPTKLTFADTAEDFHQLIIETKLGSLKKAFRRSINHETFIEPIIIDALRLYYNIVISKRGKLYQKERIFYTIAKATSHLLNFQVHGGDDDGAVCSRRIASNEQLTMYSTSDFICALVELNSDYLLLKKVKYSTLRGILFICTLGIYITVSILLPLLNDTTNYWATVPIGIALSVFSNILTDKLL